MFSGESQELREVILRLYESPELPDYADLFRILEAVINTLRDESPLIRPRDGSGRPGGLLLLNPDITTVIVPDLHARRGYVASLIDMEISGKPLLNRLADGTLQVVCVGDGMHSEARGAGRWRRAWEEYQNGYRRHAAMDEEMTEGLSLMAMVMILKTAFPENFHFLKGNHENVTNSEYGGNRPFGKYAWEGQMVRDWFLEFPGEDMLNTWADFENLLPLLAVGNPFLVSHAEPREFHSRRQLIEYRNDEELIFDFIWTGNGEAQEGSVRQMLDHYLGADSQEALYFGGHRPVRGLYGLRADNNYVQIHNPERYVVVVLESGRIPDPLRDVRLIDGEITYG
jgi:hypothetical protein